MVKDAGDEFSILRQEYGETSCCMYAPNSTTMERRHNIDDRNIGHRAPDVMWLLAVAGALSCAGQGQRGQRLQKLLFGFEKAI